MDSMAMSPQRSSPSPPQSSSSLSSLSSLSSSTSLYSTPQWKHDTGLKVLPVFYYVNPSAIQNQIETFAEAFAKHEDDPKVSREKLQIWKTALREVGNISGWHLHDRPKATVIRKITRRIVSELYGDFSSLSKELVGMESRVEEMMAFLGIGLELDDVRFIGIWGMGGVGKTALAEVIYCKISNQFEAKSFISVSSIRETGNHGLVSLQKQLLYKILKEREVNIWDVHGGIDVIGKRLHNRKVLIVLDDVDEKDQLDALARMHDWFGPRSRIIITSRDKHLLERYHMDMIYRVKGLEDDKALELFS
ncbi:disease resistance protein RUN1-like [Quercus robur]|uniref:disease resistance protein RUN1-like n=1 Tax=Quercus robur TaxID=38942 RepID=UPI0021619A40|nr:disease resistance protein RUN1-like [Quercus robur]